jgi:Protein of unknown function (DUF3606)
MIKSRLQSPQASQSMAINVRERMAHNQSGAAPDRSRISMNKKHEVRYWTEALGCSEDELAAAVAKVGNSAHAVRREVFRAWAYGRFQQVASKTEAPSPRRRPRGRPRKRA